MIEYPAEEKIRQAVNVADILHLFLEKKIVKPVNIRRKAFCHYELTELGDKFQILLYRAENIF